MTQKEAPYLLITISFRISMLRKIIFTHCIIPLIFDFTFLIFYYEIGLRKVKIPQDWKSNVSWSKLSYPQAANSDPSPLQLESIPLLENGLIILLVTKSELSVVSWMYNSFSSYSLGENINKFSTFMSLFHMSKLPPWFRLPFYLKRTSINKAYLECYLTVNHFQHSLQNWINISKRKTN